jgi:hypothetical protein
MVSGNSMSTIWYGETLLDLGNGVGQPFDTGWFAQTIESSNNGLRKLYVHNRVCVTYSALYTFVLIY